MKRKAAGWCAVAEPLSWQTLDVIAAAMTVISIANGYHTDAGANVDREQLVIDSESTPTLPRLAVVEDSWTPNASLSGAGSGDQLVLIEGAADAEAADAELAAHRLRADIVRAALGITRQAFSGLTPGGVTKIEVTGERGITRRPDGMNVLVVQVRIKLACVERASA
jgi:hypothetical protein